MKKNIYFYTNILTWGLVLFLIGNYAFGWTTPSASAPDSNLPAPLNVSSTAQSKAGYLSIATSITPSYPLDVAGSVNATTYYGDGSNLTGISAGLWTDAGTYINANNATNVVITDAGSVGIGTTSPGAKLHVQSSSSDVEVARFAAAGGSGSIQGKAYIGLDRYGGGTYPGVRIGAEELGVSDNRHTLVFQTRTANSDSLPDTKMVITYNGNVGIGTTNPGYPLTVIGSPGVAYFGSADEGLYIQSTSGQIELVGVNHALTLYKNVEIRAGVSGTGIFVKTNGNVGIGTTSPGAPLDVDVSGTEGVILSGLSTATSPRFRLKLTDTSESWLFRFDRGGKELDLKYGTSGDGSDIVTFKSDGNVGIGTTSPGARLDVQASSRSTYPFRVLDSDGTVASQLTVGSTGAGSFELMDASHNVAIHLSPTASAGSYILGNNVGIGTTSPDNDLHIDVNESSAVVDALRVRNPLHSGTSGYGVGIVFEIDDDAASRKGAKIQAIDESGYGNYTSLAFLTGNQADAGFREGMRIKSNGNVGIGTTAPARKLHVVDTSAQIRASYSSATDERYTEMSWGGIYTHAAATNNNMSLSLEGGLSTSGIQFRTGTEGSAETRMFIRQDGNVGIGTTGPNKILEILKTDTTTGPTVRLTGAGPVLSGGRIGTLEFHGGRATGGTTLGKIWVANQYTNYWDGSSGREDTFMAFFTANNRVLSEQMRINNAGNVGIGDTTPTYKLDVAGTGRFTGNLTGIGFFYSSDARLKENIQRIETPLAKIMKLEGISFNWKESGKKSMGLIAQDVEKVFPEIVKTEEETGLKTIEYAKLVAPLIEAVKEQQKMIDEQRELIDKQGEEIKILKALFK